MRIAVLITCHNRKSITVACLDALYANTLPPQVELQVVLVDDGSTDGTRDEVRSRFPDVHVVTGSGSLFWNRGMQLAQTVASESDPDFFLWLNDDTKICVDAIERLLKTHADCSGGAGRPVIVVGATSDPDRGHLTYAGMVALNRLRRFTYRKVWSADSAVECEAMNGNVVLISRQVFRQVGNLDPVFEHAMGDIDYGLRARSVGVKIFVAAGVIGYCRSNPPVLTWRDSALPFQTRWRLFVGRKGLPPKSWRHFVRRHSGVFWPFYFGYPYLRFCASVLVQILARPRG